MSDNANHNDVELAPIASVPLQLRCCEPVGIMLVRRCGEPARWHRMDNPILEWDARCDRHRRPSDVHVPAGQLVRRVRVTITADVAAVYENRNAAETEGVIAVTHALEAVGATVNLLDVQSLMVRNRRLP